MKKVIFSMLLALVTIGSQAQFKLTPAGMRAENNEEYIVIEAEGKTKQELYKAAMIYLNGYYSSPQDVLSTVENESISINGVSEQAIRRTNLHAFDMNYSMTIDFKDGKMRVNRPVFKLTNYAVGKWQEMQLVYGKDLTGSNFGIYDKKGELRHDKAKEDLERFFEEYLTKLAKGLDTNDDW